MDKAKKKEIRMMINKVMDMKKPNWEDEVRRLAKILDPTIGTESHYVKRIDTTLTPELYYELRLDGLKNREIAEQYNMKTKQLANKAMRWRKQGKIERLFKNVELTKERYLRLSNQGLTDREIAENLEIHHTTVYRLRKSWGINKQNKKEGVSKVEYLYHKSQGLSDLAIAKLKGISLSTVTNYKRNWGLNNARG